MKNFPVLVEKGKVLLIIDFRFGNMGLLTKKLWNLGCSFILCQKFSWLKLNIVFIQSCWFHLPLTKIFLTCQWEININKSIFFSVYKISIDWPRPSRMLLQYQQPLPIKIYEYWGSTILLTPMFDRCKKRTNTKYPL